MKRIYMLLTILAISLGCFAQDHDELDIDVWQVLKAEAAKDPFAHSGQFTINFSKYTVEEWCYPLSSKSHVISPFGGKRHHAGTDIKSVKNDTIRAAFDGHVVISGPHYAYGNFVLIQHANGLETAYSHNSKNLVKKGAWVHAGEPIALEGQTGRASTYHLHFETRVNGRAFDSKYIWDHENRSIRKSVFVFRKKPKGFTISEEE